MKSIDGGVCAAKGYRANGVHCGIRKNQTKKDLALIISDVPAAAAAIYTTNLVKGAPLTVTKEHISNGRAQAMFCNSGNANTCNADGIDIAQAMCALVQEHTGIAAQDVIIASTGVIGQPLCLAPVQSGMQALTQGLSHSNSLAAASAIMTTDTKAKQAAVEFTLGGTACRLGGIAKGSGMIHPNMATMLCFLTTDAAVSPALLQRALAENAADSFHMLSIDGDTSTNDMVSIMANGLAGNKELTAPDEDFAQLKAALHQVTSALCRMLAADGEGATRLLECAVTGAQSKETARTAAKSVVCSSLVKSAIFGADANWGRVLCALGYSGAALDPAAIAVRFSSQAGEITVCENGAGVPFSEEKAKEILLLDEITIHVCLGGGTESAVAWGCDLTYDYVRINGDYRT